MALEPGFSSEHEFTVEGALLTDVGGTIGIGSHERRMVDVPPAQ